jgi:hypothetical protein
LGFGLGVAQPGRRAAAQEGERPRPSEFCAVAGRKREGPWAACQKGHRGVIWGESFLIKLTRFACAKAK